MMKHDEIYVKMMEDYFELEASRPTPQYGFIKGLQIFGEKGYQEKVKELKNNLIGIGCI